MTDSPVEPDEPKPGDVVAEAKERYERAKNAYSRTRSQAIEDTRFVLGDSDNGWQWPESVRADMEQSQRVCLTVNVTAQHCNQIINSIRENRPSTKILPVDGGADKKSAEIMGGLVRNIQVSSNADMAHDTAAEHSIWGGEGYWRVLTEYESPKSFQQCIKIKAIQNPLLVYLDPDHHEPEEKEWGFIFEDITKTQAKRDHSGIDVGSWIEQPSGWVTKDSVRRAEYFYCEYASDEALLLQDGTEILRSEAENPEKWAKIVPQANGAPFSEEFVKDRRETQRKQWKWCKLLGGHDKPVSEKDWAGSFLPIIQVVGVEANVNGEIVRKGLVRDLKDPARMVNYSYSAAIQTVALQNKVPYIGAIEAIEGHEDKWAGANQSTDALLPYNAYSTDGKPLQKPERQMPSVMPEAQVRMLALSVEQMRAASGQQNSNFGIKSEAQSGIGIQRLKQQGEVATFHFPDNQVRGLRYEALVLIDLIPKIYDTQRVVRILGLDGKHEQVNLDPNAESPFQEATPEEVNKIFNPSLGRYDVVIDIGPSYQTQRQEAFASLSDIAAKNPALMQVAGDLVFRAGDFPMAEELADRLEKTLPPGLADDKNAPIPPQAQAKIAQLGQQVQQMTQMLDAAEAEVKKLQEAETGKQAQVVKAQADQEKNHLDADIRSQELDIQRQELLLKQTELQIAQFKAETERAQADADAATKAKQAADAITADQAKTLFNGELQIVLQQMKDEAASNASLQGAQGADTGEDAIEEEKADPSIAILEAIRGLTESLASRKAYEVVRDPQSGRIQRLQ